MKISTLFYLFVVIVLVVLLAVIDARIPSNTVIFKGYYPTDALNDNITKLCIVHAPVNIIPIFTDKFFCHWNLGLWTNRNNFYMLSTSRKNSVSVFRQPPNTFQLLDHSHYIFKDCDYTDCIINMNEIYLVNQPITVLEAIHLYHKIEKSAQFTVWNNNCQRHVSRFLYLTTASPRPTFPLMNTISDMFTTLFSELTSPFVKIYTQR